MSDDISKTTFDGYCGTSYAAKLLGVSVGTVQGLVEKNELQGWKTHGGHRRIALQSIRDYLFRHKLKPVTFFQKNVHLRVLIVEDDQNSRLMLQAYFDRWALPIDVVMYSSAIEALLDIPIMHPHVLVTDLRMPSVDGFQFLKTLSEHAHFSNLVVIVTTGMSDNEIAERGGLPEGAQVLHKPVDMDWMRGFFGALISVMQLNMKK